MRYLTPTAANLHIHIRESAVPVRGDVRAACEIFGLGPLYVANEGRFIAIVPAHETARAQGLIGAGAVVIGSIDDAPPGMVTADSTIGTNRILTMLSGEQLPRIC